MNTEVTESGVSSTSGQDIHSPEYFGCVKWFNTKLGYGFITPLSGDPDVFVHHSAICSDSDTYKYLVQGEYVQFELVTTNNTSHPIQAVSVTGILKGKLMCDVHHSKQTQTRVRQYHSRDTSEPYGNTLSDQKAPHYQSSVSHETRYDPSSSRPRTSYNKPSGTRAQLPPPYIPQSSSQDSGKNEYVRVPRSKQ